MTNIFITAFELYNSRRQLSNIFRLQGRSLREWSEELGIGTTKVLELLAELKRQGKISDVEFV